MTGLDLLTRLSGAGGACREAAMKAPPSSRGYLPGLASAMLKIETQAHAFLSGQARVQLPAPAQDAIGQWADRVMSLPGAREKFAHMTAPDTAADQIQRLVQYANEITMPGSQPQVRAMMAQAPQAAGGFSGTSAPAAPQLDPQARFQRAIGILLSGVSVVGAAGAAVAAWRHDKKAAEAGTPTGDPDAVTLRMNAQQLLDTEAPGTTLSMGKTPGGHWVASVKKGRQTITRNESKKPGDAAEKAVRQAIEATTLAGEVEAEVIMPAPKHAPEAKAAAAG